MTSCAATTTIREALENRAHDCRIAGAVWNELPKLAQVALYGIAAELDDAADLLASLEQLVEAAQAYVAVEESEPDFYPVARNEWESRRDAALFNLAAALAAVGPGEETK